MGQHLSPATDVGFFFDNLPWLWFGKVKRGSKKEINLLFLLFLVELRHIGFYWAAVRTSLLRALQLIRQVSVRNNTDLPPTLGGDGLDEALVWICVQGRQCWWETPSCLASGSMLLEMYGLWKVMSTAALCWAGPQQAPRSRVQCFSHRVTWKFPSDGFCLYVQNRCENG